MAEPQPAAPIEVGEDARKQLEADFHNRRERARREMSPDEFAQTYTNGRFYAITRKGQALVEDLIEKHARGRTVLDYCCGRGNMSLRLARAGASMVRGVDISAESVQSANDLLEREGHGTRARCEVMDAENLTFPDATFDLVVCAGVLHHLDVNAAYPQLARVLKPGGIVLCIESLGYNPAIQLYRRLTPKLRTAWEVDHILTKRQLTLAKRYFRRVDVSYLYLASLLAIPLHGTRLFSPALAVLERVDDIAMRVPGLRLMAWQMVFTLSQPRT